MSNNNENKLVPKLRFPEYENGGEWEKKTLGAVTENVMYGMNSAAVKFDGENQYIRITDIDEDTRMYSPNPRTSPDGPLEERYSLNIGDLLIARTGASVGKSYLHRKENGKIYFAGFLIRFSIKDAVPYFVYAQTLTKQYQKWILATSVRSGQPGINAEEYKSYPIFLPINPKEQQKIAFCLSSLDDVITTENQKLQVLKEHKKGLLQKLFPQEGETLPKLRFKEFEKSGEWKQESLGEIGEPLMCKRIFAEETNGVNGVPFYKIGTLGGKPDSFINRELFEEYKEKYNYPKKGEILITCSGTVGKCLIFNGEDAYYQDSNIVWIDNSTLKVRNEFLYYILSNINWNILNSTTITRIYGSDLKNLKIIFPEDTLEQQRIASLLSSIDLIIALQINKIEILKSHKNGLLQNLFPEL